MEAHVTGSTDNAEERFVKLQSKNTGSGHSHGEVNSAVFLLHHPLKPNFRGFFHVHYALSHLHIFPLAKISEFKLFELLAGKI